MFSVILLVLSSLLYCTSSVEPTKHCNSTADCDNTATGDKIAFAILGIFTEYAEADLLWIIIVLLIFWIHFLILCVLYYWQSKVWNDQDTKKMFFFF